MFRPLFCVPLAIALVLLQQVPIVKNTGPVFLKFFLLQNLVGKDAKVS